MSSHSSSPSSSYTSILTRAPTGVWANFAPTGGGRLTAPRRSRKLSSVARSGKRHSKAWEKVYRKYLSHFIAKVKNDDTRGHQRSNFTVVRLRPTFPDTWRRNSWTVRVRTERKKAFDSPFTDLSVVCSQIWPQVNGLASRGHERSKWSILEDFVFLSWLWTPKIYVNYFTTIVFSSSSRVE